MLCESRSESVEDDVETVATPRSAFFRLRDGRLPSRSPDTPCDSYPTQSQAGFGTSWVSRVTKLLICSRGDLDTLVKPVAARLSRQQFDTAPARPAEAVPSLHPVGLSLRIRINFGPLCSCSLPSHDVRFCAAQSIFPLPLILYDGRPRSDSTDRRGIVVIESLLCVVQSQLLLHEHSTGISDVTCLWRQPDR
jgi:hypothetical protein